LANQTPKNLKELLKQGIVSVAKIPEKNNFSVSDLDNLDAYTLLLTDHDYASKSPLMWNTLYGQLGLNIRYIVIVANPENAEFIIAVLKQDPKYLGGGFGSGWKEQMKHLNQVIPPDLKSANIPVKKNGKLSAYNTDAKGFVKSLEEKFIETHKKLENSNIVILGAGGVGKEVARFIATKNPKKLVILNRTVSKAEKIAEDINKEQQVAEFGGEDKIKETLLDQNNIPDAIINLTQKGTDGKLKQYSAFAEVNENNNQESLEISKQLKKLNSEVIVADINLTKTPPTKTLEIAKKAGIKNLLDGLGMVVYQAAPAYVYIQKANPELYLKKVTEEEALEVFKKAIGLK